VVCTERSEATGPSSASEGLCYLLERTPAITGGDLETAQVGVGSFGDPVVLVTLTEPAAVRYGHATAANVGRQLAILLDGRVLTAPVVQTEIGSEAVIEGGFSEQEAQDLAVLLRAGALPAPARIVASEPIPAGPWLRSYRLALPAAGIVTALSAAAAFVLALRLLADLLQALTRRRRTRKSRIRAGDRPLATPTADGPISDSATAALSSSQPPRSSAGDVP
jgi:preprotein translocase subunit SecD